MTRDELGTLLMNVQREELNTTQDIDTDSWIEMVAVADEMVRQLWPVLAQVWDDGFEAAAQIGKDWNHVTQPANPYGEVVR